MRINNHRYSFPTITAIYLGEKQECFTDNPCFIVIKLLTLDNKKRPIITRAYLGGDDAQETLGNQVVFQEKIDSEVYGLNQGNFAKFSTVFNRGDVFKLTFFDEQSAAEEVLGFENPNQVILYLLQADNNELNKLSTFLNSSPGFIEYLTFGFQARKTILPTYMIHMYE